MNDTNRSWHRHRWLRVITGRQRFSSPRSAVWALGMLGLGSAVVAGLVSGCRGVPADGEREAQAAVAEVGERLARTEAGGRGGEDLTADSGLDDYLAAAMRGQPRVRAAYFAWAATVDRITVERSLPDPLLTFQMDLREVVQAVMPGLMMDFPGPGKLGARAAVVEAESRARYFGFQQAVLAAAFDVKQAYFRLRFLEDRLRLTRENLALVGELEQIARAQNAAGRVTLQDVLRAQIEEDRIGTEVANLADSRNPLLAALKAAVGLGPADLDLALPTRFDDSASPRSPAEVRSIALARSPRLRAMTAELNQAEAGIQLARTTRVPDFTTGIEADVYGSPYLYRPRAGVTLPLWRDKIAAEIRAAQNRKEATAARLSAAEIDLAVEFADRYYAYREAVRNLGLFEDQLIPKALQSVAVARAGYLAGQIDFFNLIDAQRTLLDFQLRAVDARLQLELASAALSLLVAGIPPDGAPLLPESDRQTPDA
ncbi:MAG: TolC family protein [Verrucomicrobiales bacterium]|nr:TolC family protein [Verrucomicrobiales bacterium]